MITIYFLKKMLGQIAVCLRQLEGEKAVTINYVLPLILQLKKKWKAELNFTPDFGFLINFAIENLEDRFKFNMENLVEDGSNYLLIGTFLDPRFMDFKCFDQEDDQKKAVEFCTKFLSEFIAAKSEGSDTTDELHDFLFGGQNSELHCEVSAYSKRKVVANSKFKLLEWWKNNSEEFPSLGQLVKRIYSIPASSAPSERVFSRSNLIVSHLRSQLTNNRAKSLCYISMNHVFQQDTLDW